MYDTDEEMIALDKILGDCLVTDPSGVVAATGVLARRERAAELEPRWSSVELD